MSTGTPTGRQTATVWFVNTSALLEAIVHSSEDAIITKNLNGTITSWNPAAQRILGYAPEEIVGGSILKLIPPEMHSEEEQIISSIRAGRRVEHYETVRVRKDGERINVALTISPMKDSSGTVIGASKIARDISERKRIERSLIQAEKLASSGRMAASIAHEINNPLEAILNLIYLARANANDATQVETYLGTAESELVRLTHIAKQTLGFYRENSVAARVELGSIVKDAAIIYEPRLLHANVQLKTEVRSTRSVPIKRGEIMQVLSNMISNASAAMPSGGTLSICLYDAAENGREGVRLDIQDSGTGIEEKNLVKIFEPFFTTREAVGTGIGLWVAKQFIEGHGGSIQVFSSTGPEKHGTRMSIFLPLENEYSKELSARENAAQPS